MTTLVDHLRTLLGGSSLAADIPLLTAADARAATVPRRCGVLYSETVQGAIDQLAVPHSGDTARAAYYLGLQVGWRVAQRLR
jgi:hypothetical protein